MASIAFIQIDRAWVDKREALLIAEEDAAAKCGAPQGHGRRTRAVGELVEERDGIGAQRVCRTSTTEDERARSTHQRLARTGRTDVHRRHSGN